MNIPPPPPPSPPNNPKRIERGPGISECVAAWLGRTLGTILGVAVALAFTWALWQVLP